MLKLNTNKRSRKAVLFSLLVLTLVFASSIKSVANDSLRLAQSYINLNLSTTYFDSISTPRISKIVPFIENELSSINDSTFITENAALLDLTYSYLWFLKAQLMFSNSTEMNRGILLDIKNMLDKSVQHLNNSKLEHSRYSIDHNPFYGFIGLTSESFGLLRYAIANLKSEINPYFNKDIYPDFRRLFFAAKNTHKYHFDSLQYFADLYNMEVDFRVLENIKPNRRLDFPSEFNGVQGVGYGLDVALDLMSQYMQLSYIAFRNARVKDKYELYLLYDEFSWLLNPGDSLNFNDDYGRISNIPKDTFFWNELNVETTQVLRDKLKRKFRYEPDSPDTDADGVIDFVETDFSTRYFFPDPAPFPSTKYSINHFLPDSLKMKQVDRYIRKCFDDAGYVGRLHYFYNHSSGFTVSTGLERIEKNGAPANPDEKRWDLTVGGDGKFSLYQIFKTIFFATESDFRIIACVVAPRESAISDTSFSVNDFTDLFNNSYSSLPLDLEEVSLPDKTLTILVYHFYQSDIGEVPVLDISGKLSVHQHLSKTTSLLGLIN